MRPAQREAGCAGLFRHSNAPGESQGRDVFGKILLPAAIATSIATRVATGIAARVAARVAGPVAQAYVVVVAQRGGREERQTEKFIAHIFREFLAGRDGAEAIGGDKDLHLGQHLEDDRHADRQLELVIAFIGTGHADGADHALQAIGHDGLVGDGQKDVFIHPPTAATPLYTATQNLLAFSLPAYTIEQRIKYARLQAGLSGEALARLMGINYELPALSVLLPCDDLRPVLRALWSSLPSRSTARRGYHRRQTCFLPSFHLSDPSCLQREMRVRRA